MKNKVFIYTVILAVFLFVSYIIYYQPNYRTSRNLNKVQKYTDSIFAGNKYINLSVIDSEQNSNEWKYYNGLLMYAMLKSNHKDIVESFYDKNILENGTLNRETNFFFNDELKSVDDFITVLPIFYLNNTKYDLVLNNLYNQMLKFDSLKNCGHNYRHKDNAYWKVYPFALDGLYGVMPFYIKYNKKYLPNNKYAQWIFERMNWVAENLKNEEGLYNHGIAENGKNTNGVVWLRGVGWYAMAQVEVLEDMPDGKQKEKMSEQLADFFDSMILHQNNINGMWKNVVYPNTKLKCNYYETSGSAMMSYALLRAYNQKLLTDEKYLNAGLKAFNGVVESKLKRTWNNKLILKDIYYATNVKKNPEYYCNCRLYVKNDTKGIASLILASTEVQNYLSTQKK